MSTELSLYGQIENLTALLDTQDMVSDEQRVEIEREIVRVALQVEKKVDSVSGFIRHCEATEKNIDAEITRLKALKAHYVSGEARCKGYVADIIRAAGKDAKGKYRPLEGKTSVMRLQANGGIRSLVVDDDSRVPDGCCRAVVTLPYLDWINMCKCCEASLEWQQLPDMTRTISNRESDTALLRSALMEQCQRCGGAGIIFLDGDENTPEEMRSQMPCNMCGGDGLQRIPGGRLLPRGESLVVR